ncbi:unnamed protein product [Orchesella dallaii]|uniref:TM2 domain-containing protein n=1 Tax=Orchesella dallaii TaxID=48710 RepID=A0ABP1QSC9_9HEXA
MKRLIFSKDFVLLTTLGLLWISAFANGEPEPKESLKGRQSSKTGDDDSKTDNKPSGSSHNSHTQISKQTKSPSMHRDSHFSGSKPCSGNHDLNCSELDAECIDCKFNEKCTYGDNVTVVCQKKPDVVCKEDTSFTREMVCQYCYQTPLYQQICNGAHGCNSINAPRQVFKHNCTVIPSVICLGNRKFYRMMPCNWKNGYRWSTSFILSVTLGGFGADRFYLGRWQEGIGKLFSFGGLGLWTIIDIILIGVRYLGPADGSLFVD